MTEIITVLPSNPEVLLADYSFAHPAPSVFKQEGYVGVIRYLSFDSRKNLTKSEAAALHQNHLGILLVWETTANRAAAGTQAGVTDAKEAAAQARALGYPSDLPIFFAVDFDAQPAQVQPYFNGVKVGLRGTAYRDGCYGGKAVVDGINSTYRWQTAAWSHGGLSTHAHLFQRATPVGPVPAGCDQNVVCKSIPMWLPQKAAPKPPAPTPAPAPAPAPKPPTPLPPTSRLALFWHGYEQEDMVDLRLLEAAGGRRRRARIAAAAIRLAVKGVPRS